MYRLEILKAALKQARKLPPRIEAGLKEAMRSICANEPSRLDVKPLRGIDNEPPIQRLRIGQYRVLFQVDHGAGVVRVVRVGHRSTVYRGLEHLD